MDGFREEKFSGFFGKKFWGKLENFAEKKSGKKLLGFLLKKIGKKMKNWRNFVGEEIGEIFFRIFLEFF